MYAFFYAVSWLVYYPLVNLARIFFAWAPLIRERMAFENKNGKELGSQSFRELAGVSADMCFEFSSEGEYQQVASLIEDALKGGKKIELVFFSPSVEKTVIDLAHNYSTQVRFLRYPILTGRLLQWITAPHLVMVRYDLFPELLSWALKPNQRLTLLWLTFKRERIKGTSVSWLKRLFLKQAANRVYASTKDTEYAAKIGYPGVTYDFRMEQIRRRMESRAQKLTKYFPLYPQLEKQFSSLPRNKRLLIGNAWPMDLELLQGLPADYFVVVVPHQLKPEIIESMRKSLVSMGRTPQIVTNSTRDIYPGSTFILDLKGILCELYSDFGKAYVGGGFGESVHSLLEPLVAGSEMISCGPRHFRSTEYDMAQSFGRMREVNSATDFQHWLKETPADSMDHGKLKAEILRYPDLRKDIFVC